MAHRVTPYEFLRRQHAEELPEWLDKHRKGDSFPREQFFASRIVYYPGSGTDGHPVKMFGSTHSAHCFIYADYGVTQQQLEYELEDRDCRFRGYHTVDRLELEESDILFSGRTPWASLRKLHANRFQSTAIADKPVRFLEVLERDQELDDNHGPRRLAVLFLGADGTAAYDALFCRGRGTPSPFAVLLENYGFGGSNANFGQGGLLERIAKRRNVLPALLLVGRNTNAWSDFHRVSSLHGDLGGMHANPRYLYEIKQTGDQGHDQDRLNKLVQPTSQSRLARPGPA